MSRVDNILVEKSVRITPMRQLVLEYFLQGKEIVGLRELELAFPRADRITIYRTLKTFEQKGIIHSIDGSRSEISLIWIFIAQLQMTNSWRIGIDFKNKTELVTTGMFSVSRNPIFLGILLAGLGLFVVIPNAFTLLVGVLSFCSIQTQVRLEESFLIKEHGAAYKDYCNKVSRWI